MRTVDHDADELVGEGRIKRLPQRVQDALGEPGRGSQGRADGARRGHRPRRVA